MHSSFDSSGKQLQLINHGVGESLVENVKKGAEEFFNLPMEEKKKFKQRDGNVEGYGQAFVVSKEQKLDWADMFFLFTLPSHKRKPHLFPNIPLPFRFSLPLYLSFPALISSFLLFWLITVAEQV